MTGSCQCTCDYGSLAPGVVEPPGRDSACPIHGCTCLPPGGTYESYEGPQRDCPMHGEQGWL